MRVMIACRAIDNMAGGVERQAIALANELTKRGHEVALITFDREQATAFYDMHDDLGWFKVGLGDPLVRAGIGLRLKRLFHIRKVMKQFRPDTIIAFQDGMFLSLLIYTLGLGIKLLAAERESLDRYTFVKYRTSKSLVLFTYRFADQVLVQCDSYVKGYPEALQKKLFVVHNAIRQIEQSAYPKDKDRRQKVILCVGRLSYQKNQSVLIEAFSRIHGRHEDWILQFVGAGEHEDKLVKLVRALGVEDKVEFVGAVKDISAYYCSADFLCIPSLWEGFPNVLGEALAHGLPAVGYEKCGGVCDLIMDGENGLLCAGNGDLDSLTEALEQMMRDDEARSVFSEKAKKSVEQYSPSVVYDRWESVLEGVRS